jgi:hypothetical protein
MVLTLVACDNSAKTGALGGAGIGALAGQAIGGNTSATLIGAGVGAGVGYIIGNEKDKKHAEEVNRTAAAKNYDHNEVGPLGGTRWVVTDLEPHDRFGAWVSKTVEFRPNGHVVTTTKLPDGTLKVADESYRVVGRTLIVTGREVMINATYTLDGNTLLVDAEDFHAVLQKLQ